MKNELHKKVAKVLFLAAIFLLLCNGILAYDYYQRVFQSNTSNVHSYQTIRATNQTLLSINQAALDVSNFLYTKNLDAVKNLPDIIITAKVNLATLFDLIHQNEAQKNIFAKLKPLFDAKVDYLNKLFAEASGGNVDSAMAVASDPTRLQLTQNIMQNLLSIKITEVATLNKAITDADAYKYQADRFFILAGSIDIILFLLSFIYIRRYLD